MNTRVDHLLARLIPPFDIWSWVMPFDISEEELRADLDYGREEEDDDPPPEDRQRPGQTL